jgi:hypothetical protein
MRRLCSAVLSASLFAFPLAADPFIEALETAIEAYRDGDLQYAEDELIAAQRVLADRKAAGLAAFLPEPLEGWTREIDTEAGQMLAFMGGGTIAKADYSGPGGQFELTLMADNPFVAQLGMMLGNAAMVAQMGAQIERIDRVRFMREENSLKGMVGPRVLVQAEGADPEVMLPFLEQMDFRAIEAF